MPSGLALPNCPALPAGARLCAVFPGTRNWTGPYQGSVPFCFWFGRINRPSELHEIARMSHTADLSLADFRRLPGLYRRWELTEVCEPSRNYQIEDAGTHADGTPLLAIFRSVGKRPEAVGSRRTTPG